MPRARRKCWRIERVFGGGGGLCRRSTKMKIKIKGGGGGMGNHGRGGIRI